MSRRILKPFEEFFKLEAAGGIVLLLFAVIALVWANSPLGYQYQQVFDYHLTVGLGPLSLSKSLLHWINDGLMAVFFLAVGMEIKRELVIGELKSLKQAALPIGAAVGGMIVPAAIYAWFNHGTPNISGWGIPMATDIAFALGALSLLGKKRTPKGLAVFLAALAIVDDLGAVLVIALFYAGQISWLALLVAGGILTALILANRLGSDSVSLFLVLGIFLWLALLKSGVHATVAGVLLGMTIPVHSGSGKQGPPMLERLEHVLQPWVAFAIMPVFALANAGISVDTGSFREAVTSRVSIGIFFGLFLGKQIGIFGAVYLLLRCGLATLSRQITMWQMYGVSLLGGIGFTMSMFVTNLAFGASDTLEIAKLGIIFASLLSAVAGLVILNVKGKEAGQKAQQAG